MWPIILSFATKYWKPLAYVGIGLVVLFAFRIWLNKHDDMIYKQGGNAMLVVMQKKMDEQIAAKEKEIQAKLKEVEEQQRSIVEREQALQAAGAELVKLRSVAYGELQKSLAIARSYREESNAKVAEVPGDKLDDALRVMSEELGAKLAPTKPPQ